MNLKQWLLWIQKVFKMLTLPGQKGMTRVKKSGIKLHIGVDVPGLPHAIMVTLANKTDRNGAIDMFNY